MSTTKIPLVCSSCGSKDFIEPVNFKQKPTDILTCSRCKRKATVAALRKNIEDAAKKLVSDKLGKTLKK